MTLKKNLDVVIFEKLNDEIVCGKWTAGESLDIDEIAKRYDVSRTPVQQALKKMDTLGMVKFSSKGHVYARSFDKKQVEDICEIRLLLELEALHIIEREKILLDFDYLWRISRDCIESNLANNVVQTRRTDLQFHRNLVFQAKNECLYDLFMKVHGQFVVANYLQTRHTHRQQEIASDEHEKLLEAIRDGDFELARSITTNHIQEACKKILMRMKNE